jgi:hypothetical protein
MVNLKKILSYLPPIAAAGAAGILASNKGESSFVPITAALTAGLATKAVQNMLGAELGKQTNNLKTIKGKNFVKMVEEIKTKAGLQDVPVIIDKNYENAAYVPFSKMTKEQKQGLKDFAKDQMLSKDQLSKNRGSFFNKILDLSEKPKGGIIVGEKLKNPYVVAHELGHAMIENKNDSALYNILQRWSPFVSGVGTLSTILGVGASLAGTVASESLKKTINLSNVGKNLIIGGLASRLAGDIGTIAFENRAHNIGEELLEAMNIPKEVRSSAKNFRDTSIKTYAVKPLQYLAPFAASKVMSAII